MIDQDEFAIGGMVSIWVGNFASDAQFDEYMNMTEDFENDFGFRINDHGIREAVVKSSPVPIEQLVKGFSNCQSFAPAVVEAAKEAGCERATTMIVFYSVWFAPAKVTINPQARLKFLGAFPFS
jgi:hypothetical protein